MRSLGAGHGMSQPICSIEVSMTGHNSTMNMGGYRKDIECEVFAIDKGIRTEEREVANCLTAREDRGLSSHKQEGTLICKTISKSR